MAPAAPTGAGPAPLQRGAEKEANHGEQRGDLNANQPDESMVEGVDSAGEFVAEAIDFVVKAIDSKGQAFDSRRNFSSPFGLLFHFSF